MIIKVYNKKGKLFYNFIKKIYFVLLVLLSVIFHSCTESKTTELEQLLNQYASGDTMTYEVDINNDQLKIRSENDFQIIEKIISIHEINDISYHFAGESNEFFPHQIVINCSSENCVVYNTSLVFTEGQTSTSTFNFVNLHFKDKKAALMSKEIILEIKKNR